MSDNVDKKKLMEIVDRLPPKKVVQVLEFAKNLQSTGRRDPESIADAMRRTRGKYKNVLSSTEEFAAKKSEERFLEDR